MPSLDGILLCIGELERSGQVVIAIAVLSGLVKRCVAAAHRPIFASGAGRSDEGVQAVSACAMAGCGFCRRGGGVLLVNARAPLGYAVITAQTPSYLTARYDTSRKTGCTPLEFACMQVSPTVPSSWVTTCALCAPNTTVSQRTLGAATQPDSRSRNAQVKLAGLFALYTDNTIEQKAALVHALQALPAVGGGARVGRMRAQVQVLN
jgi:hypothetical protein